MSATTACADALAEPGEDIDARDFFKKMVAEGRARYGDVSPD